MHKGTMIDELIASVERAEEHVRVDTRQPRLPSPDPVVPFRLEVLYSDELVGVA
jgi:hypothetical protein